MKTFECGGKMVFEWRAAMSHNWLRDLNVIQMFPGTGMYRMGFAVLAYVLTTRMEDIVWIAKAGKVNLIKSMGAIWCVPSRSGRLVSGGAAGFSLGQRPRASFVCAKCVRGATM